MLLIDIDWNLFQSFIDTALRQRRKIDWICLIGRIFSRRGWSLFIVYS